MPEPPSEFHCSFEYHAARSLSKTAILIYYLALRFSKTHGNLFSYSAQQMADYLGIVRETANHAFSELEDLGFFVREQSELFCTTQYRVLAHSDWAKNHPDDCTEKMQAPREQEEDPLALELFIQSGCKFKIKRYELKILRSLGVSDQRLTDLFSEFLSQHATRRGKLFPPFALFVKNASRSRAA